MTTNSPVTIRRAELADAPAIAEIYNEAAGTFSVASGALGRARSGHYAFLLPHNNRVLIGGGTAGNTPLSSAEIYTPWTGRFSATGSAAEPRNSAAGSVLAQDGLLLVAGGAAADGPRATAELYGFPVLKTDKDDYAPGHTVTITGGGWQPGERVKLLLHEDVSPSIHSDRTLNAVADASGNIFNNDFAPDKHDVGIRFHLTAIGAAAQNRSAISSGERHRR